MLKSVGRPLGVVLMLVMVVVACKGKDSLHTSRIPDENTDKNGKPATVGKVTPTQPIPVAPTKPVAAPSVVPGVGTVQALDSGAVLECDASSANNGRSLDLYELKRFDQQEALTASGKVSAQGYIENVLSRLSKNSPVKADRLRQLINSAPSRVIGAPAGVIRLEGAAWLPDGCSLKHIIVLVEQNNKAAYLWDEAAVNRLAPIEQAVLKMHIALATEAYERGEARFLAVRRMNRQLFLPAAMSFDDFLKFEILVNPTQPFEYSYENGDVAYVPGDDEGSVRANLGDGMSVAACGYQLQGQNQKAVKCEAGTRDRIFEVFSQARRRILRIQKSKAGLEYLRSPVDLDLPATTTDYWFSGWKHPNPYDSEEFGKLRPHQEVSLTLNEAKTFNFKSAELTCAAGQPIRLKPPQTEVANYSVAIERSVLIECVPVGDLHVNMDGQGISAPVVFDGGYSNTNSIRATLSADSKITLARTDLILKAGSVVVVQDDKSIAMQPKDSPVVMVQIGHGTCQVQPSRIIWRPGETRIEAKVATPCTVRAGQGVAKIGGVVYFSLESGLLRGFNDWTGENSTTTAGLAVTVDGDSIPVRLANFGKGGNVTRILYDDKGKSPADTSYYSPRDREMVRRSNYYGNELVLCYDYGNQRWEYAEGSTNCGVLMDDWFN